jgi:hypothetical protein
MFKFMAISKKKASANYRGKKSIDHEKTLQKQLLGDLERRISMYVGSFLVLTEEGDPTQIALAHQKAKSEFLKFAPEMAKVANNIGGSLPEIVHEFLDSVDFLLHSNTAWLDEDTISHCFNATQKLESELK